MTEPLKVRVGESLVRCVVRGLARVDLSGRVHGALPPLPPARARVQVIAVGKAAPEMTAGVLRRWPKHVDHALVVTSDGTPCDVVGPRVEVMRASHPIPDVRSVAAARRVLALAKGRAEDLLVTLLSGGASALLCAPPAGFSLEQKQDVSRKLLASGATIGAINTVRRHLSRIKGGGLTRSAFPGRVLALLASDVVVGAPEDIGSGPTLPDPTNIADARDVVGRFVPSLGDLPFVETLKRSEPSARRQRARVIVGSGDLAALVADELCREGFLPRILPPSTAPATDLLAEYSRLADELRPGEATVRAAEPSIAVPLSVHGRGGRAGHLAALVASTLPSGAWFLAVASDGVDGTSKSAGAVVDAGFVERVGEERYRGAIEAFDSEPLHLGGGTAIVLGPTGKNFADVHVLARVAT